MQSKKGRSKRGSRPSSLKPSTISVFDPRQHPHDRREDRNSAVRRGTSEASPRNGRAQNDGLGYDCGSSCRSDLRDSKDSTLWRFRRRNPEEERSTNRVTALRKRRKLRELHPFYECSTLVPRNHYVRFDSELQNQLKFSNFRISVARNRVLQRFLIRTPYETIPRGAFRAKNEVRKQIRTAIGTEPGYDDRRVDHRPWRSETLRSARNPRSIHRKRTYTDTQIEDLLCLSSTRWTLKIPKMPLIHMDSMYLFRGA